MKQFIINFSVLSKILLQLLTLDCLKTYVWKIEILFNIFGELKFLLKHLKTGLDNYFKHLKAA